MRDENRALRQDQIETVAYDLLERNGYEGCSMQMIARRARASNETLYNWYGDKQGLFRALVARNAAEVRDLLESQHQAEPDPMRLLTRIGPLLLEMLLGNRAVALNRAAAADASGELGAAIGQAGRDTVMPLLARTIAAAMERGQLPAGDPGGAAEYYLDLLVGDLQLRRVTVRIAAPDTGFCEMRAERALAGLALLLGGACNGAPGG